MNQNLIKNSMHVWFMYLWDCREQDGYIKCFECGKKMYRNTWRHLSTCYSHILSKKTYPNLKGDENNIVIVHPDCHNLYTINPKKAINQFNKKIQLVNELILEDESENKEITSK